MEKEPIGPRSKFGKCLIKTVGRNWERLTSEQRKVEIKALHEDFLAQFGIERARDHYSDTVTGILDYLQARELPADIIHEHRRYAKNLANGKADEVKEEVSVSDAMDFSWMEDTITFEDAGPIAETKLRQELSAFVKYVIKNWDYYKKPFWIVRSNTNPAVLLLVTNVGLDEKTKFRVNVNAAIGASVLPQIDDDYLFRENGSTVKFALDATGGRTFWGWAFNLIPGLKFRCWMSKSVQFNQFGDDVWEQVAKAVVRINPSIPSGFQVIKDSYKLPTQ